MSQCPSPNRGSPRWSLPTPPSHCSTSPASIAGLPGCSACVRVGPPLSASEPIPALEACSVNGHDGSSARLGSLVTLGTPEHAGAALAANSELLMYVCSTSLRYT